MPSTFDHVAHCTGSCVDLFSWSSPSFFNAWHVVTSITSIAVPVVLVVLVVVVVVVVLLEAQSNSTGWV